MAENNKNGKKILRMPHNGCGGQLRQVNEEPVQAGKAGESFILLECDRCGARKLIGGK